MNKLDDIKQNEQKDLKLINESDFFITICEQYKNSEEFLKGNFEETLKKTRDYLDLCNFMGYRQLNDLICEYAEKIRNYSIIDFNKFLRKNQRTPIWNHLELLEQNLEQVDWNALSQNPAAIHFLEQNLEQVNWHVLSANPAAIHLLEKNLNKVDWNGLSRNPAAIHIIENNLRKVDWSWLSRNPAAIHLLEREIKEAEKDKRHCRVDWQFLSANPAAIHLLERKLDKVDWQLLSRNPSAIHILEREIKEAEKDKRDCRVNWYSLSLNPAAIHLLEHKLIQNKNYWNALSANPAAIHIIENNLYEVNWSFLSENPAAIHILLGRKIEEQNISPDQYNKLAQTNKVVNLNNLCKNPYDYLKEKLLALQELGLLPDGLNTKTILQTYIQCLKEKRRYDDYIIYTVFGEKRKREEKKYDFLTLFNTIIN